MYIEQAYKSLHEGWRYLIGFLAIFLIGWQVIGVVPLFVSAFLRSANLQEFLEASTNAFMDLYEGESNLYLFLMLLTFIGGLVVLLVVVKYLHKQTLTQLTTSRAKVDWSRIFFAFTTWAIFSIVTTGIAYYLSPEMFQMNFKLMPFLGLFVITLFLLPLQTSFEEYFFRGYLMQGLGVAIGNRWVPLIITSLAFGLLHIFNPEIEKIGYSVISVYIGLGFFLGIITLMDEGLELALGFHAANNMIIALLVTADWTALQTNSILLDTSEPTAIGQIVPIFIVLPILTFVFAKKYKWTDWKEKLTGNVSPPIPEDEVIV
ncbi:MAG: membrane protease YdiL (CAAX protease family) [Flavobacteriales bacterium]|jgi:membrane protease YdiL (CAAX protease family)